MMRLGYWIAGTLATLGAAGVVVAQRGGDGNGPGFGGFGGFGGARFGGTAGNAIQEHEETGPDGLMHTVPLRATNPHNPGVPMWSVDPHFKHDAFTFVRIKYRSWQFSDAWATDSPDSDYNFLFRLQELTSLKVNTDPVWIKLTDPQLFDYPFIYMLEVRTLIFTDDEVKALRKYLLNGGFLMVDDFWGDDAQPDSPRNAWTPFHEQMKRVFPDREPVELNITHPIFHCVFDLKEIPQEPGLPWAERNPDSKSENNVGPAHYKAYFDDKGRMVAIFCQNTDLGDGWEREGDDKWYFQTYSQRVGYPMSVNIVFYAMTH